MTKNEFQRSSASIENVPLPHDDPDLFKIREVKIRGCGCKNKCVSIFSDDTLYSHILNKTCTSWDRLWTAAKKRQHGERKEYVLGRLSCFPGKRFAEIRI